MHQPAMVLAVNRQQQAIGDRLYLRPFGWYRPGMRRAVRFAPGQRGERCQAARTMHQDEPAGSGNAEYRVSWDGITTPRKLDPGRFARRMQQPRRRFGCRLAALIALLGYRTLVGSLMGAYAARDAVARVARAHDAQPLRLRAHLGISYYLHYITGFEDVVERGEVPKQRAAGIVRLHLRADGVVADLGVDAVGEIQHRGAGGHLAYLALRREDEDLILEHLVVQRLDELR